MSETAMDRAAMEAVLASASVDPQVFELRPDYRVLLLAVSGFTAGPTDEASQALLTAAEESARGQLADRKPEDLPHIDAWRQAYRAFGAKPQRTRNSLEALTRRAGDGLPRINRLTDVYNAVSVLHQVPLGGEDLDRYVGPPRLFRAVGTESFDTAAGGADVIEHPEPGEVVWGDDAGVTCRRWNWRQGRRTGLREDTATALFVCDALGPMSDAELQAAGNDLVAHLGPDLVVARRLIGQS